MSNKRPTIYLCISSGLHLRIALEMLKTAFRQYKKNGFSGILQATKDIREWLNKTRRRYFAPNTLLNALAYENKEEEIGLVILDDSSVSLASEIKKAKDILCIAVQAIVSEKEGINAMIPLSKSRELLNLITSEETMNLATLHSEVIKKKFSGLIFRNAPKSGRGGDVYAQNNHPY